jgi:hypothetical protein
VADTFTQVAPNSTGSKIHVRTYSNGTDTVADQYVIPVSRRTRTGYYRASTAQLALAAAADAATVGRWWLINPVGSSVAVSVKRVSISWTATGTAAAATTGPRITLERATFTGTASGAVITPGKRVRTAVAGLAADATNVGSVRTASTGLTLTAGELIRAFTAPYLMTATSGQVYALDEWEPTDEDTELILAPGEAMVCRQADAAAVDIRRWLNNITWEEFTAP